jgi:iron complex outermembrane recepter protein
VERMPGRLMVLVAIAGAVVGVTLPGKAQEKVPNLLERDRPATTVKEWMAQVEAAIVRVTGVRVDRTDQGLQVVLVSESGQVLQATQQADGNTLILTVPNAVLALSDGQAFEAEKPVEGIDRVSVTQADARTIRISITGLSDLPIADIVPGQGLVLAVTPEEVEEEEITVLGRRVRLGIRTDTPLRDIPQSIQIVPRETIEAQKAFNLGDVLRNASGVITTPGRAQDGDGVFIRGFGGPFGSNDAFRRNDLRDQVGPSSLTDPAVIERVEVLKGPASALYGQGSPGGTVNVVTKQPLDQPFYQIEAFAGNFNFYRGTLDLTGPLNDSRTVLYRLIAAAQTSGSFIDFFDQQKYLVAPSLSFQLGENTKLTLDFEYQATRSPGDFGIPASGTVTRNPNGQLPFKRYIGEPSRGQFDLDIYRIGYDLRHEFSENFELRNAFRFSQRDFTGLQIGVSGIQPDQRTFNRFFFQNVEPFSVKNYVLETYAVAKFNTGSIRHQLIAGFDLSRDETTTNGIFGNAGAIDLFNPQYGRSFGGGDPIRSVQIDDALGIYLQNEIKLADNLQLLLGGRFDIRSNKLEDQVESTTTFQQDEAFSPRVGLVYRPIKPLAIYASYSQSFQQVPGNAIDNRQFEPERGTQYEIGLKADITDKIAATLAFYDLVRTNVLTANPDNPIFSIQTGEARSRGIELDVTGEILPGWNITAGYAYTDARITADNVFAIGNRLPNVPENAFNLFTSYRIQKGSLRGLQFGLGLFFVGDRQGDSDNSFQLPSYLRTDAFLAYERDNFSASLSLKNLFNTEYFAVALNRFRLQRGEPFIVQASLSWRF